MKEIKTSYWSIIYKRLWLILLLFVSTVGTIIGVSYLHPATYLASVRFEVTAPPPPDVVLFSTKIDYDPDIEILRTRDSFIDVITGGTVARQVIDILQLSMSSEELQENILIEEVQSNSLQTQTPAQFTRQLLKVGVKSTDAELAADLTNTLVNTALQRYGELRAQSKTTARKFITSQLEATGQELNQAQVLLIDFQIKNTVGDLSQAIALQQELIYELRKNRDLAQAQGKLEEVANFNNLILERGVELQNLVSLELEYANLKSAVEQNQATYELLLEKGTEATLKENEIRSLGFIQVNGTVDPPSSPLPKVRMSVLSLGGVLSIIVGVMLAFIWDYFDNRRSEPATEVESGSLPHVSPAS